jgi:diguanylate cyclase (GGDEF)-like protein
MESPVKTIFFMSIAATVYYLVGQFSISLFSLQQPSNISILWLSFAIGVTLVHHFGNKVLPFIFMASFFANFSGMNYGSLMTTVVHTMVSASADTIAPFLSSRLLKKYVDDQCDSFNVLLPFTLYGALIPTFISSIMIAFNLWSAGLIASSEIFSLILILIFSDSLGLFLIYPVYKRFSFQLPTRKEMQHIVSMSLIPIVILVGLVYLSFVFPFFIFIYFGTTIIFALRLRDDVVSYGLLVSIIAFVLGVSQHNIFRLENSHEAVLMMHSFMGSLIFVTFGITLYRKDLMKYQYDSLTDVLTKTNNRFSYEETIETYIKNFQQNKMTFSMIMIDIDHFKSINDTYGHWMGDKVLAELTQLLKNHIRESDSVFRIGGEEFAILFPETSLDIAIKIGEKLREVVGKNLKTITNRRITISLGIAEIQKGENSAGFYNRIDDLMYHSKQNGRNQITF